MTVAKDIETKLTAAFQPSKLNVIDESHLHAGHIGARPEGETHFRVEIVAGRSTTHGLRGVARRTGGTGTCLVGLGQPCLICAFMKPAALRPGQAARFRSAHLFAERALSWLVRSVYTN
jgi:stress-induced morphogen